MALQVSDNAEERGRVAVRKACSAFSCFGERLTGIATKAYSNARNPEPSTSAARPLAVAETWGTAIPPLFFAPIDSSSHRLTVWRTEYRKFRFLTSYLAAQTKEVGWMGGTIAAMSPSGRLSAGVAGQ
jgi:hypothetical protein